MERLDFVKATTGVLNSDLQIYGAVIYTELKKMYEEDVVGEYDGIAYLKDVTRYDAKTGILTEDV